MFYAQCCACYMFQHRHGFHLTYADRELLDASPWCAFCGTQEDLHIDHCHTTNRIRGYLCNTHNKALGCFQDDPVLLQLALNYIQHPDETID